MTLREKLDVMDKKQIERALTRIATEILDQNGGVDDLLLVGIRTGGMHLAKRILKEIRRIEGKEPEFGIIDITLYRDDVFSLEKPVIGPTEIDTDIANKVVVLIDDVLYTGRTIRAAMDALIDFGRPRAVRLAVLIDRGLREFPICPDFVGRNIPTHEDERVEVLLAEVDGNDRAVIYQIEDDSEPDTP